MYSNYKWNENMEFTSKMINERISVCHRNWEYLVEKENCISQFTP